MSKVEVLLGDPAPGLSFSAFVRGEPVAGVPPGQVSIVAFWSPACPVSRASLPCLTALQAAHPQVAVLAVALGRPDAVRCLVRAQGSAVRYAVAIDAPPAPGDVYGPTYQAWFHASYQSGVPKAFIVDRDGRIAWIGPPLRLAKPLTAVAAGSWDLAAVAEAHRDGLAREKVRETRRMHAALTACGRAGDLAGVLRVYDETFALHPDLEPRWGSGRLGLLLAMGRPDALAYARWLTAFDAGDGEVLLRVGAALVGALDFAAIRGAPADAARIALALDVLDRAEHAAGPDRAARIAMRIHEALATVLLTAGRSREALARACAARAGAEAAGMPAVVLGQLDALVERCLDRPRSPRPCGSAAPASRRGGTGDPDDRPPLTEDS
ncbi:TlpA family protein disulfide reductase [Methylobacterium sp. J-092]|uniref:TlpA family protein disulfide reductase n=1 Tax=Methylobacterium sp. J-092 TaxID=2836667 RepID=UPI001FBB270F|nr:TlpA disulfide reductase family protein [Methylobacterium sp. J-092]MCJ2009709.1 TlpA family protein disulfide reductase [Methylobacterium sp. J-092]